MFFQQPIPGIVGNNNVPKGPPLIIKSSFMEDLRSLITNNVRTKPSYSDCWLVGSAGELDIMTEYDTPSGHVVIGTSQDGEVEYNLTPTEYTNPDSVNTVIEDVLADVRRKFRENGGRPDRHLIGNMARDTLGNYTESLLRATGGNSQAMEDLSDRICDIIYRYSVGIGVFDILLADDRLEDIYIDAPCDRNRIHVTMSGIDNKNTHLRCRTNLVVDRREVLNLINVLKRESGLPFCESSPILETDMREHDARATVVGYPMSPQGDAIAIRKHSSNPWTLTRLIANGTIDAGTAGLLSYLVVNRAAFLICGARGAGKSSLLSALMFEFPLSQRILTIEDTLELPCEKMRKMGYKVQSMLVDDRMDGSSQSRSNEALRVSLRLGESAIVLGEVRGEEAKTLYESMRVGRAGSSILGTIHGDSAKSVFDRVTSDMGISPESFMATDIIVTVGTFRDRRTGSQLRKVSEVAATTDRIGEFVAISGGSLDFTVPVMRRALASCSIDEDEARREISTRGLLRDFLAHMGALYGDEYFGPEWINVSNEIVARMPGREPEDVLSSFKQKFRNETGLDPDGPSAKVGQ